MPTHSTKVHERLALLEQAVFDIRDALSRTAGAMVNIAQLEERHNETSRALERAFDELGRLGARVTKIEQIMPILQLTSRWIIGGVIGVVVIVGGAAVALVLK